MDSLLSLVLTVGDTTDNKQKDAIYSHPFMFYLSIFIAICSGVTGRVVNL